MDVSELKRYDRLNEIADPDGIVILGEGEDISIPLGELRQAFDVEQKIYNRSFNTLSIEEAVEAFEKCVAPLVPESVLLHIGKSDLAFFEEYPDEFDNKYRELIAYVRAQNKKCRIAVVSLRNYDNNTGIGELNKHLKYIAESERCEYGDIASKKVWSPKSTRDTASFVHSMGFVHPLRNKRPLYDLVRMLFCCEA